MKQRYPVSLQTTSCLLSQQLTVLRESDEGTDSDLQQVLAGKTNITFKSKLRFLTRKTPSLVSRRHFVGSSSCDFPAADRSFPLSVCLSLHFSGCLSQMISRTSQGTKPLFFPLATLMKPLRSPSLLTQI